MENPHIDKDSKIIVKKYVESALKNQKRNAWFKAQKHYY